MPSAQCLVGLKRCMGTTLGLWGWDRVAKALAQRAQGFSMRILAFDPLWGASPEANILPELPGPWPLEAPNLTVRTQFQRDAEMTLDAHATRQRQRPSGVEGAQGRGCRIGMERWVRGNCLRSCQQRCGSHPFADMYCAQMTCRPSWNASGRSRICWPSVASSLCMPLQWALPTRSALSLSYRPQLCVSCSRAQRW